MSHEGTTVCYIWNPAEIDPKYGSLGFSGDDVTFSMSDAGNPFKAESLNGGGADTSSGIANLQIIAKPGFSLTTINFAELGDYRLSNGSTGTSVDVDVRLQVNEFGTIFGALDIHNLTTGPLNINNGNLIDWSIFDSFDLTTTEWDGIDHVAFQVQNNLEAISLLASSPARKSRTRFAVRSRWPASTTRTPRHASDSRSERIS